MSKTCGTCVHLCDDPTCENCRAKVNIPELMKVYCKQIDTINPFDTFVAMKVTVPWIPQPKNPFFELVVKEVFDNGQVLANIYDVQEGRRVFSQVCNFVPPNSLKEMVHLGLFVPQSFFLQFTDGRVVNEIDPIDMEGIQAN